MNKTAQIIKKLGGVNSLSKGDGINYHTVNSWAERDSIPKEWIPKLIAYGAKIGVEIDIKEFF